MPNYYGGIEAGGTKFVCAIGSGPDEILAENRFSTTLPGETLGKAINFFQRYKNEFPLKSIGIASFGPVDINPDSPTYGFITKTPKPGWSDCDVVGVFSKHFQIPIGFDTDVNGALLGEFRWGAAQNIDDCIYMTIGTGIGGGAMAGGNLVHGLVHPEMGHMLLQRDIELDPFDGCCPFHRGCLEGLASGTAMKKRWKKRADTLPSDHPAWDLEADYIAQGLHILICVLSPRRIILGGGIMNQSQLFPKVRTKVLKSLNGYVKHSAILDNIDSYIVPPGLGNRAGVLGAIALAMKAVDQ
jgi:fructokinase